MVTVQVVLLVMQVAWVSMVECTEAPLEPARLVQARVAPEAPRVVQEGDAAQGAAVAVVGDAVAVVEDAEVVVVDAVAAAEEDAAEAKPLN